MDPAKLILDGKEYELPVIVGSENEAGIDISKLRGTTGAITADSGYGNTGSCLSTITFINGEKGILRYRGYPIEEIAKSASFIEVIHLLVYGRLPNKQELDEFTNQLISHRELPEGMKPFFDAFPTTAHPMAVFSSMINALSTFYPAAKDEEEVNLNVIRLLAKQAALAAYAYKHSVGQPYVDPRSDLSYTQDFLHMMFAEPPKPYEVPEILNEALNLLLILHADHEQNCSTSTVRMVGSSQANLYASMSAGVGALWGPLHGGANQAVIEMLGMIRDDNMNFKKYTDMAKDKASGFRLMGFGHRVYKNFDPRATILKEVAAKVLEGLGIEDPLLEIAKNLEKIATEDEYFLQRGLYPNVDFYSGILYRAMNIPTNMFTVMFALGRMAGWISQWKEMRSDPKGRIYRPRQVYMGETQRPFVPIDKR
ncbi:MAG: citrate synthase [Dehalococcoidia bacterium]